MSSPHMTILEMMFTLAILTMAGKNSPVILMLTCSLLTIQLEEISTTVTATCMSIIAMLDTTIAIKEEVITITATTLTEVFLLNLPKKIHLFPTLKMPRIRATSSSFSQFP